MPIVGLTDAQPSFKEIGRLRKGAPKTQGLADLKYFRPDFRPDETQAAALFEQVYGKTPTMVNIRLAFGEIDRCWDAWYTVYNTSGMLGMADGEKWIYLRDNKSGQIVVKDALPLMPFDASIPIYSYKSRKGEDVAVYARPEGKLRVLVPELRRANYLTLVTHSYYDIANISKQLAAIEQMAKRMGLSLPMVPLTLTRRPEVVSCKLPNGGKNLQEKWLVNIDIRADWAEAQFAVLDDVRPGLALPAPKVFELPAGVPEPSEWEDDELIEEPASDLLPPMPVPTPEPETPKPAQNGSRPYSPETLRDKLSARVKNNAGKASDKQRQLVAMLLGEACQGDIGRHAVQEYLFGSPSLKNVSDGYILAALNDWLKPVQDDGGAYLPDGMALQEIGLVYRQALKDQGQVELPGLGGEL